MQRQFEAEVVDTKTFREVYHTNLDCFDAEKVLILDDDALFSQDKDRLFIGDQTTLELLMKFQDSNIPICIATKKDQASALKIHTLLKDFGLDQAIHFVIHDSTVPTKNGIFEVIKKAYWHGVGEEVTFVVIDTDKETLNSAIAKQMIPLQAWVSPQHQPDNNTHYLNDILKEAVEKLIIDAKPENVVEELHHADNQTEKNNLASAPRITYPLQTFNRDLLPWLLLSGFSTILSHFLRWLDNSNSPAWQRPFSQRFLRTLKSLFLYAFSFDGFDYITTEITSADGETTEYTGLSLPFWLMLASFLGFPSRPDSVKEGVPTFTFLQFLRGFIGGWNPVKETLTNTSGDLRFYQYRWTEKKIWQFPLILFKFFFILPFKIISIPFKLFLNLIKLVTEFLLPIISVLLVHLGFIMLQAIIEPPDVKTFLVYIIQSVLAVLVVVVAVIQYAVMLLCRVGLAFSSPEKSVRFAFTLGKNLHIGKEGSKIQKIISNVMGGLGALVSLTLSAVLWTIALPLALGGLVTVFPSILSAIQWVAQLPFIAVPLAWLSQLPIVTGSMVLLNNFFGTVGTALASAFGPAIHAIAAVLSLQIPAIALKVGTALGMILIPTATIISTGANVLSNLWAKWVESGPITKLRTRKITPSADKSADYTKLNEAVELESQPTKGPVDNSVVALVYQPTKGGDYIVSPSVVYLKTKQTELLQSVDLSGEKAKAMLLRAQEGDRARLPTPEEVQSTAQEPVIVPVAG